mgnify:CR=1 FL=1
MQSIGWYYNRIRRMDAKEIAWRLTRLASDYADIPRQRLGLFPKPPARSLSDWPGFTPGFRCLPDSLPQIDDDAWRADLRAQADDVMNDRLSYFQLERQFLGDPIDWHRDHAAGITAPLRHVTFVDYRKQAIFGDCKQVWEPNRMHQLVVLARAYRVFGDERYAEKIDSLLVDWLEANPLALGMNWKSPLEVAIRLINWIWALDFVRPSTAIRPSTWEALQRAAYYSVWDTVRKFSQGSSANNHLVGEAAGVFVASNYFTAFPRSQRYAEESREILEREILAQSFPDGCTREHAFGYQFFVLQFYSIVDIVAQRVGSPMSARYRERLSDMYAFIGELSRDTGRPPNAGDADDGYVLDLGDRPSGDVSGLLAVAEHLFPDGPRYSTGPSQTTAWLFGRSASPGATAGTAVASSRAFDDSGYYLLRSDAPPVCVYVDGAELGYGSIAAHGHADCLSLTLSVGGTDVFVDPGTFDYFSHPAWRDYYRSTRAHNTLEIDGRSQSTMTGPFMWSTRATPTVRLWQVSDESTVFEAEHDGYASEEQPIIHRRRVTLARHGGTLRVDDVVDGTSSHTVRRYFHLAPGWKATADSGQHIVLTGHGQRLSFSHDAARAEIVLATDGEPLGWISPGYHQRVPGSVIVLTDETTPGRTFQVEVVPARAVDETGE